MAEQRKFQMHEKLLLDVIKRQAGSIQKAVLEGVMNSIEAGATKVAVEVKPRSLSIADDGKGFRNRDEVEKFFETFGQPHDASEGKIWAQFRMGRGQLFAFGQNTWRTGKFLMVVDINKRLGYDLSEPYEEHKGCSVSIDLYDPLTDNDIYSISREIASFCAYVKVPLTVNGKQVNSDPTKAKWDKSSTEDAHIRLSETAAALKVYNLGVYVCDIPKYQFGIGGVIVSKKRLDVNFARNDIIKSCPVWKRIKAIVEAEGGIERIKTKRTLTPDERLNMIARLCAGELDWKQVTSTPLLVDVAGNAWSGNNAANKFKVWTMAKAGDMRGDRLIQSRLALVLDEENVKAFDCEPEELFEHKWNTPARKSSWNEPLGGKGYGVPLCYGGGIKYVPFEQIAKSINTEFVILPEAQWTPTEAMWAEVIREMQPCLGGWDDRRAIKIGQSDTAQAWTDGATYIAFDRKFLALHDLKSDGRLEIKSLGSVAAVLAHELSHDGDSTTNVHGAEFYKKYHDMTKDRMGLAIRMAYNKFQGQRLDLREKNAAKKVEQEKKRADKAEKKAHDAVAASLAEPGTDWADKKLDGLR